MINVNVHVYSPDYWDISVNSADWTIYTPGIRAQSCPVSYPQGEFSAFSAARVSHAANAACFVPPGTHYCWEDRGSRKKKLAWHFYMWPALGIEPKTFWSWVQHLSSLPHCSHNGRTGTSQLAWIHMDPKTHRKQQKPLMSSNNHQNLGRAE